VCWPTDISLRFRIAKEEVDFVRRRVGASIHAPIGLDVLGEFCRWCRRRLWGSVAPITSRFYTAPPSRLAQPGRTS
jgi:hypothetical protein